MISISNLKVEFSKQLILDGINLSIPKSKTLAIIGPSGGGKSSLIKALCGIYPYTKGCIEHEGQVVKNISHISSLVPQKSTFLPWKTVQENILLPYLIQKKQTNHLTTRLQSIVKKVSLENYLHYFPHEISGGMLQRALIARALLVDASVLILDEPCSSIDAFLKEEIFSLIKKIQKELELTLVLVTHDFNTALGLADTIALIDKKTVANQWEVGCRKEKNSLERRLKQALIHCYQPC